MHEYVLKYLVCNFKSFLTSFEEVLEICDEGLYYS